MNRWWIGRDEPFWVEVTKRSDVGADLHAPKWNEKGESQWSYDLLHEAVSGDVVFHFHKPSKAFVGSSVVSGDPWADEIVWGAQGTSARGNEIEPYARPGYRRGLTNFASFDGPTLEDVRAMRGQVLAIDEALKNEHGSPVYFPFTRYTSESLRPTQGYFLKLPRALVDLLGLPVQGAKSPSETDVGSQASPGAAYRRAAEEVAVSAAEPFARDPSLVERGLKGHRRTQNLLADWAEAAGFQPLSPGVADPDWDVAWATSQALVLVEVKSIHSKNEEKQLRLGLGQVLRYASQIRGDVRPVLVTSQKPSDPSWDQLCRSLGITLVWPEEIHRLEEL